METCGKCGLCERKGNFQFVIRDYIAGGYYDAEFGFNHDHCVDVGVSVNAVENKNSDANTKEEVDEDASKRDCNLSEKKKFSRIGKSRNVTTNQVPHRRICSV